MIDKEDNSSSSAIDFTSIGDRLIGDALIAIEQRSLEAAVRPLLDQIQSPDQQTLGSLFSVLVARLATTSAALKAVSQELASVRRSREARLRIDPLLFIPADRFEKVPAPPEFWECNAGDVSFVGSNWYRVETDNEGNWRWAGPQLASSVVLPSLGGGRMRLQIRFKIPFGLPFGNDTLIAFLDGLAVPLKKDQNANICVGIVEIPKDPIHSSVSLIVVSKPHEDPRNGNSKETRILGIGLRSVRIERLEAI